MASKRKNQQPTNGEHDVLVPDPLVCAEFNVTPMTLWRWTRDPVLNFPQHVKIKSRNYRSRRELEDFKQRMLLQAIAARNQNKPPPPDGCLGTAVLSEALAMKNGDKPNSTRGLKQQVPKRNPPTP